MADIKLTTNEKNSRVDAVVGEAIPRRGNRLSHALALGILGIIGWRISGELPNAPKLMLVGAPHTSNWDMFFSMVAVFALGLRLSFMAKHTIFRWPFGRLSRWLGGIPVDRRASHGLVGQMVAQFQQREKFVLAVLPEGTRSKTKGWKTGFYHIAWEAQVPMAMVMFDYGRKRINFGPTFQPTGDLEADLPKIQALFNGVVGKNPHLASY